MLGTPCSEVVWSVLATHSIRQFPLHFPSRASPCAITFQLESTANKQFGVRLRRFTKRALHFETSLSVADIAHHTESGVPLKLNVMHQFWTASSWEKMTDEFRVNQSWQVPKLNAHPQYKVNLYEFGSSITVSPFMDRSTAMPRAIILNWGFAV